MTFFLLWQKLEIFQFRCHENFQTLKFSENVADNTIILLWKLIHLYKSISWWNRETELLLHNAEHPNGSVSPA